MRICVISDVAAHGGAALIANGLALEWAGEHEVERRYLVRHSGDKEPAKAIPSQRLVNFALYRNTPPWCQPATRTISRALFVRELRKMRPDVISLHNIHAANQDQHFVQACTQIAPTVWTLHDMWSFTGRCANSFGCTAYIDGCGVDCPSPQVRPALSPSRIPAAWSRRREFFSSVSGLIGVSPSQWLCDAAKKGMWRDHRLEVINNGVDLDVFRPIAVPSARDALGLPRDSLVLTAFIGHESDPFKTPMLLQQALDHVDVDLHIVTFGPGKLRPSARHQVHEIGLVSSPKMLAVVYSCADLFVLPSLQENFPTVLLEAAACGVPGVGFNTGGNGEIVTHGATGWLASEATPQALATAIGEGLCAIRSDPSFRKRARSVAEQRFDVKRQARRYIALFNEFSDA